MAEQKEIPVKVDAVVIGAGLGGLVCALEMQKNGMNVCIVEKRPVAGGYAHHFRRGSHRFDASLHHLGGLDKEGMTRKLLEPLGVLDLMEFERPDNIIVSVFPDITYRVPNQADKAVEYLGKIFPGNKEGLKKLFEYSVKLKDHVIGPVLYRDFAVPMEEMLPVENIDATFNDLLKRYVSDERLLAILGQLWMYLGLPPGASSANFSNCVFASGFVEGGHHLKGGSESLVNALVSRFEREGGTLILRNGVSSIESLEKQTVGVTLLDGSIISTPFIAANVSPLDIFPGLVDADQLSPIFLHRLKEMEPSCSAYATYLGLDCPPEDLGVPRGNTFINHGNDFTAAYKDCMEGNLEKTDWCLSSSEDADLAPEGKGGLAIVEITATGDWMDLGDDDYRHRKSETRQRLLDKYEKQYPGLKEHCEVIQFGTPRTLRRFSSNAGGSLYGFAQTPDQSNNRRISNRTPIAGLYLCGAWTQAGGGFEGSMMTGMKAAHMILQASGRDWDTGLRHQKKLSIPDFSTPDYPFYSNDYEIYPDDTDYTGKAKDTTFLRFMDRARVRLMDQSEELKTIRPLLDSYYVKLYSISAHIHNRASAGETVTIQTGYKKATTHRAGVDQCITGSDGRIILTGRAEIMFVTREEELVELPAVYREHEKEPFDRPKAALPPLLFADLSNHKYESEFLVSYEDTDMQGVVYNVSYIKIAQKMMWELKDEILNPGEEFADIRCEHVDIRFMMPARLMETILVKAGHRRIDDRRFGMDYRMMLKGSNTVLTDIHLEYTRD